MGIGQPYIYYWIRERGGGGSSKFITLLRKGRWHHLSFEKYGWAQWHLCGNILDGNTKGKKEGVSNPFWLSKQTRWGFFSNHHIMFRNQVNIIKQALKITGCQPLEAAPLCRDSRPSLISRPPTLLSLLLLCTNRLLCHRCCYFAVTDYSAIADLLCTTLLFLSSRIF